MSGGPRSRFLRIRDAAKIKAGKTVRNKQTERTTGMRTYSPVGFARVSLTGPFWRERIETVLARTVPSQYRQLERHGILHSLTLPQPVPPLTIPRDQRNLTMQVFWDSDVGKWIEAAGYALSHRRDAAIEAQVDEITELLAGAQMPDGYLNCWYAGREPGKRWTNLRDNHELYCAGHLLEGAIAYFQATGRRRLLDLMLRYVDHIDATFGTGAGQKRGYCGHPEIEMALLKLYRVTANRRHLDLAAYFIDERGRSPHYFDAEAIARGDDPKKFWARTYEYNQSHKPVREQDKVVGHAVRAMYLYTAMAELAAELDDASLKRACESLWGDLTEKRMYVTAGLGPAAANEGFTRDYDLPNDTAYAETCASVGLIFWAQRMLHLDLDGRYVDVLERALFNGALAGLSRDGEHYFYENPLESDGRHARWEWHRCPCCTMNIARLIGSVGGYFCSESEDAVAIHLYGGMATSVEIRGRKVAIQEQSNYPWSGTVTVSVDPDGEGEFSVKLRIPGWTKRASASVNGLPVDLAAVRNGYLDIRRVWRKGDTVMLDLPMLPERVYAHPLVRADAGRVALQRGPLVYCLEEADNAGRRVQQLRLPRTADLRSVTRPDLFDGVVTIVAGGTALETSDWRGELYRDAAPHETAVNLTAIPYHLWSNRTQGSMTVWMMEA